MNTVIDGIKINYEIRGEGDVVLLLHGWGSNIKLFDGLMSVISAKYRAVALDLPGFGESDEPKKPWEVSDYVDFVLKFIDFLGVKKVILLGHSFGGRIIIKMLSEKPLPFEVSKVILTGSAGIKPKKTAKQKFRLSVYKLLKGILNSEPIKKAFPDALEALRKKNGSADYNSATPVMRATLVKVVNEDLTHLLQKITPPVLLIWGKNDMATPIADGELMEKLIPEAGLVKIDNAGHYSFLEQPYIFHRVISSFLNIEEN